jgi:hypothetical protein
MQGPGSGSVQINTNSDPGSLKTYESGSGTLGSKQCCGSMTFGVNPDPDADPDPAIFIIVLQDANKKNLKKSFLHIICLTYIYIIFQR